MATVERKKIIMATRKTCDCCGERMPFLGKADYKTKVKVDIPEDVKEGRRADVVQIPLVLELIQVRFDICDQCINNALIDFTKELQGEIKVQ